MLAFAVAAGTASAADRDLKPIAKALEPLLIQHEGRLKPLDTFARTNLLLLRSKSKLGELSAMEWLVELLLHPEDAYDRKVFYELGIEAIDALGIEQDEKHLYSFIQLIEAIGANREMLQEIGKKDRETFTRAEKQIDTLYRKTMLYLDLSRSLSGLVPDIEISDPELAAQMGLAAGQRATYLQFLGSRRLIATKLEALSGQSEAERKSPGSLALMDLVQSLQHKMNDLSSNSFHVFPPEGVNEDSIWRSPWKLLDGQPLSAWDQSQLELWQSAVAAGRRGDAAPVSASVEKILSSFEIGHHSSLELAYNKADLFYRSLYLYLLSCVTLWIAFAGWTKWMYRVSFWSAIAGLVMHAAGIGIRCVIMERPPVATLYESVIFVGFIIVLTGVLVELRRKDMLGLFMAGVSGVALQFIGFSYAADGDTMGMLVAVLNSIFWLATHVLTITIGYGASMAAGIFAHLYLLKRFFNPSDKARYEEIFKVALGLSFVAIFFTTLGTILGGIWGDQSWGRFWGWDPKENGALLIVIWLLIVLHGRLAGILKPVAYAAGLAMVNICVALAWFGVNLLQVGLHSYGFDDGVATNLAMFCIAEAVFAIGFGVAIHFKESRTKAVKA